MNKIDRNLVGIYVWELPVRFFHWINALCIALLCVTGYMIGDPPAFMDSNEAVFGFWFGKTRLVHFVTAFVFLFNFAFRIYWGFAGNRYASWKNFVPYRKAQWRELVEVLKVDILMIKDKPVESVGHNAMASTTYFVMFWAFVLQCLTGFGLYAQTSTSFLPRMCAWIVPLFGGDLTVRYLHHFLMWFFILFTLVHVYLVFYHDYIERRGVASSIIGGWKFIEEGLLKEGLAKKAGKKQ